MRNDLLLQTLAGKPTPHKPVWIMRQAGRYLPEYRHVRSRFSGFLDFCANPEAAAEVTVQPVERFGLDAAILFSDILTPLPPLGLNLRFDEGKGPSVSNPVRTRAAVEALREVDAARDLAYVGDAIHLTLQRLGGEVPLLGFAGGPFTVASYMIEGGGSKELAETRRLLYADPATFSLLLDRVTAVVQAQLLHQASCGVQALVLMDSWVGHLASAEYQQFLLPRMQSLIDTVRKSTGVPVLHYANGAAHLIPDFLALGATALGLDWRSDLRTTLLTNPKTVFQGNLDPSILFAPPKEIRKRTRAILDTVGSRPHIMNLGHGILPGTPIEGVQAFLDEIRL